MTKFGKIIFLFGIVVFLILATAFFFRDRIFMAFYQPTPTLLQEGVKANKENAVEIIADNLQIQWEIAFLPDGDLLVTERPGTLKTAKEPIRNIGANHIL